MTTDKTGKGEEKYNRKRKKIQGKEERNHFPLWATGAYPTTV